MSKLNEWENEIICGDTYETLKQMPSEIISCVMTSFPYWGQRDYKVTGQMGLEKHYSEWLEKAWAVMDEIWRVLRPDGTVWINLGDKYAGGIPGEGGDGKRSGLNCKRNLDGTFHKENKSVIRFKATKPNYGGVGNKSLLFIPERFAIGCLDRGWILRNKCIWQKPNPMPCSAKDRFTTTWEYLFFLTKSKKYWFDLDAVRRPHIWADRDKRAMDGLKHLSGGKCRDNQYAIDGVAYHPAGKNPGDVITTKKDCYEATTQEKKEMGVSYGNKWDNPAGANPGDVIKEVASEIDEIINILSGMNEDEIAKLKNWLLGISPLTDPTDFWSIPTQPSKLAHYASYPEKLCETPLKAGCPRWICKECGMARVQVTKPSDEYKKYLGKGYHEHEQDDEAGFGQPKKEGFKSVNAEYLTLGWTFCSCLCPACGSADCKCGEKWRPGIVLDPFVGIGTTCIVAKKLGLWHYGIDIKQGYVDMSVKRLKDVKYQEVLSL